MYSSAFNNIGSLSGAADPKTGTFSYVHSFGELTANKGLGPHVELSMSFGVLGTMSGNSSGLGIGWTFKLGSWSQSSQLLTLNNGASYKVLASSPNFPWRLSHKLKDFRVEEVGDEIFIYHKNGDKEIMAINRTYRIASITKFIAADGRYLEFKYSFVGGTDRLTSINDSESTLASITYTPNQGKAEVVTHPGTPIEGVTTIVYTSQGLVQSIQDKSKQMIRLEYEPIDFPSQNVTLYPIKKITYPTGAVEEATYFDQLYLPFGAPIPYVPAISTHTRKISSKDPDVSTSYKYEMAGPGQPGNNYWGYNSGVNWQDNYDNLFDLRFPYNYKSEEITGDHIAKCDFNKFHQVMQVEETNGNVQHKQITEHTHGSIETSPLEDQPDTYELQESEITHYETSAKTRSANFNKTYVYDDWGNVLIEKHPGGVEVINTYYPAEGEDGCPPHPFGLVHFVKTKTVRSKDKQDAVYTYKYKAIKQLHGQYDCIVETEMSHGGSVVKYEYFEDNSEAHAKQKNEISTIGGKSTTKSFSYTFNSDTMKTTEIVTGYDGTSLTTSMTQSNYDQKIVERVNEMGLVTVNIYNELGQLQKLVTGPGTKYESATTYEYFDNPELPTGEKIIGASVLEKGMGADSLTYYNGDDKEIAVYQRLTGEDWKLVSDKTYDNQTRLVSKRNYDYIVDQRGNEERHVNELTYKYDTWGRKCETKHNNGLIIEETFDPVKLQMTRRGIRRDDSNPNIITDMIGSTVITYNDANQPIKVEEIDTQGIVTSTTAYTYDGFGRRESVTTPTGDTARIKEYDDFSRPIKLVHLDGTEYVVEYAKHSGDQLIETVSVPSVNYSMGRQDYDGLSRVVSKTVSGVTTQLSYTGAEMKPSRRINGRGQTTLFEYIPELGEQTGKVATFDGKVGIGDWKNSKKVSECEFIYGTFGGKATEPQGRIIRATCSAGSSVYDYTPDGFLKSLTQTVDGQSNTCSIIKTTYQGKPIVESDGKDEIYHEYDEFGESTGTIKGDTRIEFVKDHFGRVIQKLIYAKSTGGRRRGGRGKRDCSKKDETKVQKKPKRSHAGFRPGRKPTKRGGWRRTGLSTVPSPDQFSDLVQSTDITYDEHSREIMRTITAHDTDKVVTLEMVYDADNKVIERVTSIESGGTEDEMVEKYEYDKKKRVTSYNITSHSKEEMLPRNEHDRPFISQSFAYDVLDNVTHVITSFPNGNVNTATYIYDGVHKQRLDRISNTLTSGSNAYPPRIQMGYDADGNVTSMNDTVMTYSVSGRMTSKNGRAYTYDPFDRLIKSGDTTRFFSTDGFVVHEVNSSSSVDFIHHGTEPIGEISGGKPKIYGLDQKLSVISVTGDSATSTMTYSPYGTGDNGARIGLNGELKDEQDRNAYSLGDGTRTYWPGICSFTGPDSYSPFFGGGINPYAYCSGDPINSSDPSGHSLWKAIVGLVVAVVMLVVTPFTGGSSAGIALGVIGGVLGVVASSLKVAAEALTLNGAADQETIDNLMKASGIIGIVSSIFSIAQVGAEVVHVTKNVFSASKFNFLDMDGLRPKNKFITTGYKTKIVRGGKAKNMAVVSKSSSGSHRSYMQTLGKKKFGFQVKKVPLKVFSENLNPLTVFETVTKNINIPFQTAKLIGVSTMLGFKINKVTKMNWESSAGSTNTTPDMQGDPNDPNEQTYEDDEDNMGSESDIDYQIFSAHDLPFNKPVNTPQLLGFEFLSI